MHHRNLFKIGLVAAGLQLLPAAVFASGWGKVSAGMTSPRDSFASVQVGAAGKVYLLGGRYNSAGYTTNTVEYFTLNSASPLNSSFTSTGRNGKMVYSRSYFPAIPLQGTTKILLPGGFSASYGTLGTAELFDTSTNRSATTGSMNHAREQFSGSQIEHSGTSQDGMALVVGGYYGPGNVSLGTSELYNPSTGRFSYTAGSLNNPRFGNTQMTLSDGRVLVAGGRWVDSAHNNLSLNSVEYYNPATGLWTLADANHQLVYGRFRHTMTALNILYNNYPVLLITGGYCSQTGDTLNTAEIGLYDPVAGEYAFSLLTSDGTMPVQMSNTRMDHTGTLLYNGSGSSATSDAVLVVGGWSADAPNLSGGVGSTVASADLVDVIANTPGASPAFLGSVTNVSPSGFTSRHEQQAVLLPNHSVLVAGGLEWASSSSAYQQTLNDAWIFTP